MTTTRKKRGTVPHVDPHEQVNYGRKGAFEGPYGCYRRGIAAYDAHARRVGRTGIHRTRRSLGCRKAAGLALGHGRKKGCAGLSRSTPRGPTSRLLRWPSMRCRRAGPAPSRQAPASLRRCRIRLWSHRHLGGFGLLFSIFAAIEPVCLPSTT